LRRAVDAHLAQRSVVATTEIMFGARFPAIRVMRKPEEGKVSVIVATRESPDSLNQFIETLGSSTRDIKTELIVVDMESVSDAALDSLMKLEADDVRIARMIGPAQRERAFNTASNIATGEFLVFCTDDMRPLRSGWLTEMLSRLSESRVGAVTPTLLWPTGVVQQCGLVLGPEFSAARAFQDVPDGDLGYAEMLATAHEVAAAGAAGLLVRRSDFLNFNGFDTQRFGLNWAAIDFSLRLRSAGLRIIGTPYAKLKRLRVDRRLTTDGPDSGDRAQRELEYLRVIWGDTIANDELYHPFLSQSGAPYSALAWPPRPTHPRMGAPPRPHKWPDGI
jgi:hypothetical protein